MDIACEVGPCPETGRERGSPRACNDFKHLVGCLPVSTLQAVRNGGMPSASATWYSSNAWSASFLLQPRDRRREKDSDYPAEYDSECTNDQPSRQQATRDPERLPLQQTEARMGTPKEASKNRLSCFRSERS